jgi:hypothetical protein
LGAGTLRIALTMCATRSRVKQGALPLAALLLTLVVASGCRTAPILAIRGAPLPTAPGGATQDQLDEAIWRAGRKLGWKIERIRPGLLRGTLRFKRHVAVVSISHDGRTMNIDYEDSENLLYSGERIHHNYNELVKKLAARIQQEPLTR